MIRSAPMPENIKEFIQGEINIDNLNAVGLYEKVVARFGYVVNRSQVLSSWQDAFVGCYKKDEDQLVSSRLLVRSLREEGGCEEVQYDGLFYFYIGLWYGVCDILGGAGPID